MKTKQNNIKLGAMVLITILALVIGLYLIGDKKNLFGDTFLVSAKFNDVSGLTPGNNVRFGGVDVGTVESVEIFSDTSVWVIMRIDEEYHQYIKANSVAMLGNDGMMGNRLVNISSIGASGPPVAENQIIGSVNSISMDETTRTLSITNNNLKEITDNVKSMTEKLDSSALWAVISDTAIADNLRNSTYSLSESLEAISNSFLVKGLSKGSKKKEKKEKGE
jgi:phospholipid/cholesterol/gamma-HCH transport system substrate-binding protein